MAGEPAPVFAAIPTAGWTGRERLGHRMGPSATTGGAGGSGAKLCFPYPLAVTTADNRLRHHMRAPAAAAWTGCASGIAAIPLTETAADGRLSFFPLEDGDPLLVENPITEVLT